MLPNESRLRSPDQILQSIAHGEITTLPETQLIRMWLSFDCDANLDAEGKIGDDHFSLSDVELNQRRSSEIGAKGIGTELVHQFLVMLLKLKKDDARFSAVQTLQCCFISEAGCRLMIKAFAGQNQHSITFFLVQHTIKNGRVTQSWQDSIDSESAKQKMIEYEIERERIDGAIVPFGVRCAIDLSLVDTIGWKMPTWNERST